MNDLASFIVLRAVYLFSGIAIGFYLGFKYHSRLIKQASEYFHIKCIVPLNCMIKGYLLLSSNSVEEQSAKEMKEQLKQFINGRGSITLDEFEQFLQEQRIRDMLEKAKNRSK